MRMSRRIALYSVSKIKTLNDYSWAEIKEIADNSTGRNYFSVGDCKEITLQGTMNCYMGVGTKDINTILYVYIIGFDHNSTYEGTGIHFSGFKTSLENGIDVFLNGNACGSDWGADGSYVFAMNLSAITNSSGWVGCDMRYSILGSTDRDMGMPSSTTATSPVQGTVMSIFPSDLRSVLAPMYKYTDNQGLQNNSEIYVTRQIDYLPLASEYEIFGTTTYSNPYEQSYQQQYEYFAEGNSTIKYQYNKTTTANYYWLRSPHKGSSTKFVCVSNTGTVNAVASSNAIGICLIFKVGGSLPS